MLPRQEESQNKNIPVTFTWSVCKASSIFDRQTSTIDASLAETLSPDEEVMNRAESMVLDCQKIVLDASVSLSTTGVRGADTKGLPTVRLGESSVRVCSPRTLGSSNEAARIGHHRATAAK
jgi:hypothetical protein